MKNPLSLLKTIIAGCLFMLSQELFAQDYWNGSSTVTTTTNGKITFVNGSSPKWSVYSDNAGNFAQDHLLIGPGDASSPKLILAPDGGMELRSNTHTVFNVASLGTGVNPYLRFSSNGSAKWSFYSDYNTDDFLFASTTGGSGNVKMLIKQNGNVGIGTALPGAKLDVGSFIPNGELGTVFGRLQEGNSTGSGTFLGVRGYDTQPTNTKSFAIEHSFYGSTNSSVNFHRGGGMTGGFITFNTDNNAERIRISTQGNVGIGTTTPESVVDIQSNVGNSALRIQGGLPYGAYYLDVTSFLQSTPWSVGYSFNLKSNNGNFNNIMTLIDGNVGIGTTTPDAKLTVKGDIHTKEVRVDLAGSVGPDYVFEENYNLTSLTELEAYLKQNKHLPEVPSAKQMEEEGIKLKEMNLLLLKKVEELTLYVIELKKRDEAQQKQNEIQQNEIESLKAKYK